MEIKKDPSGISFECRQITWMLFFYNFWPTWLRTLAVITASIVTRRYQLCWTLFYFAQGRRWSYLQWSFGVRRRWLFTFDFGPRASRWLVGTYEVGWHDSWQILQDFSRAQRRVSIWQWFARHSVTFPKTKMKMRIACWCAEAKFKRTRFVKLRNFKIFASNKRDCNKHGSRSLLNFHCDMERVGGF